MVFMLISKLIVTLNKDSLSTGRIIHYEQRKLEGSTALASNDY